MIINDKIRAAAVQLTDLNGIDLGIVSTTEALRMARELKVDLVCLSLASSPPPCKLVRQADHKDQINKARQQERKVESGFKCKEIRLTAAIEEHDYETKSRQAERILTSGDAVQLTILVDKKDSQSSKRLAERLVKDLLHCGKQEKGIQISGKQVSVIMNPIERAMK